MMAKQKMEEEVRACLAELWPARAEVVGRMRADLSIWEEIDSLSLLELVEYLENRFGFRVAPIDFIPENFGSIRRIATFVSRQLDERRGAAD